MAKPVNVEDNIVEVEQATEVMSPVPESYITEEIVSLETPIETAEPKAFDGLSFKDFSPERNVLSFKEYARALSKTASDTDHVRSVSQIDNTEYQYAFVLVSEDADGEVIDGRYYYFQSEDDLASFKSICSEFDVVKYCIEHENPDLRIGQLCCILNESWYENTTNLWNLAGFLYRMPHADLDLMRKTYLAILYSMTKRFNLPSALAEFNNWKDSKYRPTINERKLKSFAAGCNADEYNKWKDEYEIKEVKEKTKSAPKSSDLADMFDITFKSARKLETLTQLVELTGRSIDDMRSALIDGSFEPDELEYWAEKYLVIENKPNRDFELNGMTFEKMLKTTNFESLHILKRFILYFIHEFYVFEGSNRCYYKRKPTDNDNAVFGDYSMANFTSTSINYYNESTNKHVSNKLCDILITIPFHKFSSTICKWNHDPTDFETFSTANPFQAIELESEVKEEDLHPMLLDYLMRIICFNDADRYQWLLEYLASICYFPDYKTNGMLVLYSIEKQVGKSNLRIFLSNLIGTANLHITQHLTSVFSDRGAPQLRCKKICWLDEISGDKRSFRSCLERMKSAITDEVQSSRKLYHEEENHSNITEYIGASNNLIGVVEDKMTIFDVNPAEQHNKVYYGKLIDGVFKNKVEMNKFFTYLKPFATSKPKSFFRTPIYDSMTTASNEGIVSYVNELKENGLNGVIHIESQGQYRVDRDILYKHYQNWCEQAGEIPDKRSKFCERLPKLDKSITFKRFKEKNNRGYGFFFPVANFD